MRRICTSVEMHEVRTINAGLKKLQEEFGFGIEALIRLSGRARKSRGICCAARSGIGIEDLRSLVGACERPAKRESMSPASKAWAK